MNVKKWVRRIMLGKNADSESLKRFLVNKGCKVGERTVFFSPSTTFVDTTRPYLISIGDDVQITHGVTILTHGYDWSVIKGVYGNVLGSVGRVSIGNNVFIGMNTTILKGVHIGNNVIIGAGSLVNSDIPNNTVAAGNPARVIMSLEQYYAKRLKAQEAEAVELVKKYRERNNGKNPSTQDLSEFFWLFSDKDDILDPSWKHKMSLVGNEKYSYSVLEKNKKMFSDMNEFLNSIKR